MSTVYVYKTKKKQILAVLIGTPDGEGTSKITVLDSNIPPSKAELIDTFEANTQCDYISAMVPILLKYLSEDKRLMKIVKRIEKEGL